MQEFVEFASNNALLVSGLFASALAVIFYELRAKARNIGSVNAPIAVQLINKGAAVVDIREVEKFAAGHIGNAHNVPETELMQNPETVTKKNKNALLVCDTGLRSADCAARLRKEGADNVFSLKGGIAAWQEENLPVVSE